MQGEGRGVSLRRPLPAAISPWCRVNVALRTALPCVNGVSMAARAASVGDSCDAHLQHRLLTTTRASGVPA